MYSQRAGELGGEKTFWSKVRPPIFFLPCFEGSVLPWPAWRAVRAGELFGQQRRSGGGHPTHSFKDPHQRRMVLNSFTPVSFETETGWNQGEIEMKSGWNHSYLWTMRHWWHQWCQIWMLCKGVIDGVVQSQTIHSGWKSGLSVKKGVVPACLQLLSHFLLLLKLHGQKRIMKTPWLLH